MESFSRTISQLSREATSAYFSGAPATPTKQSLTVSTLKILFVFCTRDRYLVNLVNVVFVRENVEHAKHLVQGRHNLHAVALLADVPESFIFLRLQNGEVSFLANGQSPKDRDVVEDDGDHLEDFTGLNGRGSVLDEEKFFLSKNSRLPP